MTPVQLVMKLDTVWFSLAVLSLSFWGDKGARRERAEPPTSERTGTALLLAF